MKLHVFLWAVLLWLGGWTSPARADRAAAMLHYEQAMEHYNAGRFGAALLLFEQAYEEDPTPTLRYNIAQSHWKLGRLEEAISGYRQYLAMQPDAGDRVLVEQRIAQLQRQVSPPPPAPAVAEPASPVQEQEGTSGWHLAAYTIGSVGLASAVAGGVFGLLTRSAEDDVASAGRYDPDAYDAGKRWERLQYVLLATGAGAVAVAGVLFLVGGSADDPPAGSAFVPMWLPMVTKGGAGLTARGEF